MAVRIRLTRVGATKRPAYRVIAIDKRRSRDGRALEILGFYDPLTEPATVQLDRAKIQDWISKGAQPSDTVVKLMRQAENDAAAAAASEAGTPKRPTRATAPKKPSKKAQSKKAAVAEAEPAPPADETPANETEAAAAAETGAEPAAQTTDADAADEAKAEA